MATGKTPRRALPYPLKEDPDTISADIGSLAKSLDNDAETFQVKVIGERPVAKIRGRQCYVEEGSEKGLYWDSGSVWIPIGTAIETSQIKNEAITAEKLAKEAVTEAKILKEAVTLSKISKAVFASSWTPIAAEGTLVENGINAPLVRKELGEINARLVGEFKVKAGEKILQDVQFAKIPSGYRPLAELHFPIMVKAPASGDIAKIIGITNVGGIVYRSSEELIAETVIDLSSITYSLT